MLVLDVNVLLAAHREDHPNHRTVRPWFDQLIAGEDQFAVPVMIWASFLRLAAAKGLNAAAD